jgi:phage I-like protein
MVTENTLPTGDEEQSNIDTTVETSATPDKVFTQDEVNRLMGQTRRDERSKYGDYGHLQERAKKADELEQAQLTENEQLQARATEAERKASDADLRIAQALIASDVKVQASRMGIVDPDAAYLLLDRSQINYSEDDGVTGVEQALTRLLEEKPYLKGQPMRSPNLNVETGQPAPVTRLTDEQREAARMFGMSDEDYAKNL